MTDKEHYAKTHDRPTLWSPYIVYIGSFMLIRFTPARAFRNASKERKCRDTRRMLRERLSNAHSLVENSLWRSGFTSSLVHFPPLGPLLRAPFAPAALLFSTKLVSHSFQVKTQQMGTHVAGKCESERILILANARKMKRSVSSIFRFSTCEDLLCIQGTDRRFWSHIRQ